MEKHSKRAAQDSHSDVHETEPGTNPEDIARKAENEGPTRESGGSTCERDTVGRAADDAVQQHDIGILDAVGALEDVSDAERRPFRDSALASELAGVRLPGLDELDDLAPVGAGVQQLGLECPDSAADLEHTSAVEAARGRRCDHPPLEVVQALLAMTLQALASQARLEDRLARPGATATRHGVTITASAYEEVCSRSSAPELMQYRFPEGPGPSSKTCPR